MTIREQTGGLKGCPDRKLLCALKSVKYIPIDFAGLNRNMEVKETVCDRRNGNDTYNAMLHDKAKQDSLFHQIQNQYAQFLSEELKDIKINTNSTRTVYNFIHRAEKESWKANVNIPCKYETCMLPTPKCSERRMKRFVDVVGPDAVVGSAAEKAG